MADLIRKNDSIEKNQEKLNRLQNKSAKRKQKSFMELCGALKGLFKEEAVVIQRKLRDEWP